MRVVSVTAGAVLGAAVAVAAVLTHRHAWAADGVALPWGLVLGVGTAVTCGLALRGVGWWAPGFAIGWTTLLVALLPGGPGGDYVFLTDGRGWGLLTTGVAAGALVLVVGVTGRAATS
ncbi:MAG: hypothetical protein GEU96_03900 [Propionibacteriales bacterium]|nr:hypothetical protein [Propionibacteriales bacterium]